MGRIRRRLLLHGRVQRVGLRVRLLGHARDLKVVGRCRNLRDDSVEVHVAGDEDQLGRFHELLTSWRDDDPHEPDIRRISVFEEGQEGFDWPPGVSMDIFEIYYGENLSEFEQHQAERSDMTVAIGLKMIMGQRVLGEKVDLSRKEMKKGFTALGAKVDAVGEKVDAVGEKVDLSRHEMKDGFHNLGEKADGFLPMVRNLTRMMEDEWEARRRIEARLDELAQQIEELKQARDTS